MHSGPLGLEVEQAPELNLRVHVLARPLARPLVALANPYSCPQTRRRVLRKWMNSMCFCIFMLKSCKDTVSSLSRDTAVGKFAVS